MWRRFNILVLVFSLLALLFLPMVPLNSRLINLLILLSLAFFWLESLGFLWKRKPVRVVLILVPVFLMVFMNLPGSDLNETEIRENYVNCLKGYTGTMYVWGGENSWGIDCSGLPRRALRDALVKYGFRHGNPAAFRLFFEHWWYDASAKALGQGYRNYIRPLPISGTIETMSYDDLLAGDLAVTTSGIHVLAYIGEGQWIQADPGIGSVIILDGRTAKNGWFNTEVTMHRWNLKKMP